MKRRMVEMARSARDGTPCLVIKQKVPQTTEFSCMTTSGPWQDGRYPVDGRGQGIKMAGAHDNRLSKVTSLSWQAWDFPGFTGGKPHPGNSQSPEQTGKVVSVGWRGFGRALLPRPPSLGP